MTFNTQSVNRPSHIEEVITGVERYNPDNLPQLEEYLGAQCRTGEYDLLSNLAILELYQFNPSLTNIGVVASILAKALTALPDADFSMYLSLLNSAIISDESIKKLLSLQRLLEECRYQEFWKLNETPEYKEILSDVSNFDRDIRLVIATSISSTFDSLPKPIASGYLNLKDSELEKYSNEHGWKVESEEVVINTTVPEVKQFTVPQQQIKLEQLTKIISQSNQ